MGPAPQHASVAPDEDDVDWEAHAEGVDPAASGDHQRLIGPASLAGASPCRAGEAWTWDGVEFLVLHPDGRQEWDDNDSSCTLRVAGPGGRLLLLADTEARAEEALRALPVAADVALVPHHGSRSSSTEDFVGAVRPALALVSAGFGNRFGLPRPEVVARCQAAG